MIMTTDVEEVIREIRAASEHCFPDAEIVCLFGSFARKDVRPFSDVDVGLQLSQDPDILTLGDMTGRLEERIGRSVDILLMKDLAERDPELAYRIAAEAILISQHDRDAFAFFKKRAFLHYFDTEHLRTLTRSTLHRRVSGGNMGKRNYV